MCEYPSTNANVVSVRMYHTNVLGSYLKPAKVDLFTFGSVSGG